MLETSAVGSQTSDVLLSSSTFRVLGYGSIIWRVVAIHSVAWPIWVTSASSDVSYCTEGKEGWQTYLSIFNMYVFKYFSDVPSE